MSAVTGLDKVMRAFDMGDRVSIVHSDGLTECRLCIRMG